MKKIVFVILFTVFFSGCVTDQQFEGLSKKVNLIEEEQQSFGSNLSSVTDFLDDFEKKNQDLEKNLRSGYANLIAEKTELKNKVSELNGEIEKIFYRLDLFLSKLETIEKRFFALEQRVSSVENYLDFDKNNNKEVWKSSNENLADDDKQVDSDLFVLEKASEEEIYEQGKKEFDLQNYNKAKTLFIYHEKNFPKSSMADNSLFWLGEIYYKKADYKRAIIEYQNVIEKYPSGNKVPSAYLKQGLAFYKIDSKDNAKIVFEKLILKFPLSNEAHIAKKKLKSF